MIVFKVFANGRRLVSSIEVKAKGIGGSSPTCPIENGVMTTPKRRSILSFIFTCLCVIIMGYNI